MNKVASRRIDRELDLTYFIRKQLMTSAILNALTSKQERVLVRKNYRLTLSSKTQAASDSNTTTESDNRAPASTDDLFASKVRFELDQDRHRR